jgi:hypothetical protein
MARRRGTERVTIVNKQTLGGGWQIRDLFTIPVWLLLPYRLIYLAVKYWQATALAAVAALIFTLTQSPILSLIITLAIPLAYQLIQFALLYRQHSSIPLKGVIKGLYHIHKFRFNWAEAAGNAKLGHPSHNSYRAPPITHIEIANPQGTAIRVRLDLGATGNTSDDLQKAGDRVLAVLEAHTSKVTRLAPGRADYLVSWERPLSSNMSSDQPWHFSPEQHPVPVIDLDETESGVATVDLATSILIGGMSEAGKSNEIWHLLNQLNRQAVPYRTWVLDPVGGVELEELEGSPLCERYEDDPNNAARLVAEFYQDMQARLLYMKQNKLRRFVPSPEHPFKILAIDELLILAKMLREGVDSPLGRLVATGRKAGYVVWACTQLGQKEVISHIRDLFPQRICLRTKSTDLTDCILGSLASQEGAHCHRISRSGEGYVWTDRIKAFVDFYTPLMINTHSIAQGGVQTPIDPITRQKRTPKRNSAPDPGPTFVYQLFDHPTDTYPVYVGIATNPSKRFRQHSNPKSPDYKPWFSTVIHQRSVITLYQTRERAKSEESKLIDFYQPKYNVQERTPTPSHDTLPLELPMPPL